MERELTASLNRLGTSYLDSYLVHNPETILHEEVGLDLPEEVIPILREKGLHIIQQKLYEAFEGLEKEVAKGRIRSYGISSNALSFLPDDPFYLPFTDFLTLAKKASQSVHKSSLHNFKYIQFPANILERSGLQDCAPWAHENGINVLVGRPLNAFDQNGNWRLASYERYEEYEKYLSETLRHFAKKPIVHALLRDLDREKSKFSSVEHYQSDLRNSILPVLAEQIKTSDEMSWDRVMVFLLSYENEIRYLTSKRCEEYVSSLGIGYNKDVPLQQFALKYLVDNPHVTCVLNGITDQAYLDDVFPLLGIQ